MITFYNVNADINGIPLLGRIIYIDPGHGGRDPGTSYYNILEKDINLKISFVIRDFLIEKGAIVYLTRDSDIDYVDIKASRKKRSDLNKRIEMIESNGDIYLSIHVNWFNDANQKGIEVLYNDINSNNKRFAQILMDNFINAKLTNRKLKTTNLYMYQNINVPGVLIECGFLSNYYDRSNLLNNDYYLLIAKSISNSLINYFNS